MAALHAFFVYLDSLEHATSQATAVDGNGVVHYGGQALQAFLVALQNGWHLVWLDQAS